MSSSAGRTTNKRDGELDTIKNADYTDAVIWHPADIFANRATLHKHFGIIVLNQPLELRASFYATVWQNSSYHVGADGGANRVYDLDKSSVRAGAISLDTVIGDMDSIRPEVKDHWFSHGSEIIQDGDQYSTDFTKAVRYLKTFKAAEGAKQTPPGHPGRPVNHPRSEILKGDSKIKDIVAIGGLGGRIDQGMSTLHHLYTFQNESGYEGGRMFLLSNEAIAFVLKSGTHRIKAQETHPEMSLGKHVGIIPLKEPSVITTQGLEWDVVAWVTEFGGQMSTSNHVREEWVTVETTKDVLFTIDMKIPLGA
jgi:thiamine pyrophosphokinase